MKILGLFFAMIAQGYAYDIPMNSPYRDTQSGQTTSYQYLFNAPDHFDPIKNYEWETVHIISQIYEPLFTVAYNSHPPILTPLVAASFPKLKFYDNQWKEVVLNKGVEPAYTSYVIDIKPNIFYQPHDGFCKILKIKDCQLFKREVKAEDFAYQIKRIAQQNAHSPYASICSKYIYGFDAYQNSKLAKNSLWHDLRQDEIAGVKVLSPYRLEIITKGFYQQWLFWMTMSFFTPIPWEIDQYYNQYKLANPWKQYSIGTGGYMLNGQNKYQQVVLLKNPNYRKDYYQFPDGKKQIPIIDRFVFNLDGESIPRWNKFLQGYYDFAGIPPESFENTIQIQPDGKFRLSDIFQKRKIDLHVEPEVYTSGYVFNFLDPVVGGYDIRKRKLRQAISLAFDFDEFRAIFRSGRGASAYGPIPPNLMNNIQKRLGYNYVLYNKVHNKMERKNIEDAKKLLTEAGYKNGIDPKTGKPLIINFLGVSKGLPEEKEKFNWMRKQVEKLGIQLNIREYDDNRFNNKILAGQFQMLWFTWGADYPDPENFLMLFYGPNQHSHLGGPNWANFKNKQYDKLYELFKTLADGPQRDLIIKQMLGILWNQAVWVWGTHGDAFYLTHNWMFVEQFEGYASGTFKYMQLDKNKRIQYWIKWNQPEFKPIVYFLVIVVFLIVPFVLQNYRIRKSQARRTKF